MITSVLIANRGEIAVRIARTLRRLGIRSIAVHPGTDAHAAHVAACDDAISLGPDPRAYLDIDAVLAAAAATGADAIHPGYGFLSENARFAAACETAGVAFLGPSAAVIETMGSKIGAKSIAVAAQVPVVPGVFEPGMSDDDLVAAADVVGLPVLVKASAGGGGKGMRVVTQAGQLPEAIAAARREARAAFGDDALMLERYIDAPRHIEVQILGDTHGTVLAVADRECSLQRRHQKVIEEAPVTSLPTAVREQIAAGAVALAQAVGYVGAGTVEFIVDGTDPTRWYFLEMNTRLQVEHPVTELVTGLDLVEQQVRIAEGRRLAELPPITTTGVAVEARLYAEDPGNGFLPSGGRLLVCDLPAGPGVRVDSGVRAGDEVSSNYDPMLAKVVAHGPDRARAYLALERALQRCTVLGVTTNLGYLAALAADPAVRANSVHTRWIETRPDLAAAPEPPPGAYAAAALDRWLPVGPEPDELWDRRSGWRLGAPAWAGWRFGGVDVDVRPGQLRIDGDAVPVRAERVAGGVRVDGRTFTVAHDGPRAWVAHRGRSWVLAEASRLDADRAEESGGDLAPVRSPMPGTIIAVAVAPGQDVAAGEALVTVEAMKMEHTLRAPAGARVADVLVSVGDRVALDADLVRWEVPHA
jgi:acetyl-CoA/propionyl-CoA carboxylase biotin carboxyl carrier protein